MKYHILCDSSADLPHAYTEQAGVRVVPFYVSMDGIHYQKEGEDIAVADFYQTMAAHGDCYPKTSMPSIQDYMEAMLPSVRAGVPLLCICLTQKFSGSLQSALNARQALLEDWPDAVIHVMDSQLVTALQGLLVTEAVRLRDLGLSLEEAVPLLEEVRSTGQIFFTTKDLKYLEHGGRLSHAASVAGSMLNLKPVLHFAGGELDKPEVCRGRKRSLEQVTEKFFHAIQAEGIDLSEYLFGTGIGLEIPEYAGFVAELKRRFDEQGVHPAQWVECQIGATIGVHTGPYPVGLGLLKRCRA